jgi:SHS2 domain-containing protein
MNLMAMRVSALYHRHAPRGSIGDMYEFFEHTADLGLRICAPDLDALFVESAQALFAAIVEDLGTVRPEQRVDVELAGDDREYLLFDWLKELLYRFDVEHVLFSRFEVRVTDAGLKGTAWGEPLDRTRHELAHEVKAITYHGLKVEQTADGWLAEIIVDI